MAKFARSVSIKAPVEEVFNYWKDPSNWPEVWSSMVTAKDVVLTPDGVGTSHKWVYKMVGIILEGESIFLVCDQNHRIEAKTWGGIDCIFDWTFEPENGGTKMTAVVDYEIPIPVLGKLVDLFALAANEHEAEATLANLRARMEHRPLS